MKILYGTHIARWDILQATGDLTRYLTTWCAAHDKRLYRLMCYINSTLHLRQTGYVGDVAEDLWLELWVDADHGGDCADVRATTGAILILRGPNTWFPLSCISKRQTSNSNGSTEAETVALSHGLRQEALPTLQLWETLLGRKVDLRVMEDNSGTIAVVENGYSPQLRHLLKTQKVSIDLVHRVSSPDELDLGSLEKVESGEQIADIFTKMLPVHKWAYALELMHLLKDSI